MTLSSVKIFIFTPKISDDLFLVMNQVFQIFRIFTVFNVVYDPFFKRKTTISGKNSLITPLFTLLTTLFLKILGGRMHGPSPTSNFGGTVPPVPLGLRP